MICEVCRKNLAEAICIGRIVPIDDNVILPDELTESREYKTLFCLSCLTKVSADVSRIQHLGHQEPS